MSRGAPYRGGSFGRGRGGFGGGRGGRGGFQQRDVGPPEMVLEIGSFIHAVEDEMFCSSSMPDKIPYFNAPIYLQNKSEIGKVDEILGPINEVYFSIKMGQGMVASSFKKGDKVYINADAVDGELQVEEVAAVQVQVAEEVFKGAEEAHEVAAQVVEDLVVIGAVVEGEGRLAAVEAEASVEEAGAADFAGHKKSLCYVHTYIHVLSLLLPSTARSLHFWMALQPLIAICGTTGVGKSKLAVELALALGGKVINADAMQVYQGLDVLTNKLRSDEQKGVEHVLMNSKKPGEQYVVGEWVRDAKQEIENAQVEGKVPIVVGGTSYWIHHLLFPTGLPAQAGPSKSMSSAPNAVLSSALRNLPGNLAALYTKLPPVAPSAKTEPDEAFALYDLLSHLDPPMANRWHWKDTRKVLRNLEIIKENGRTASEVLAETHSMAECSCYRALIFWLYADPEVLNPRLEERVDMPGSLTAQQGLLDEIRSIRHTVVKSPVALSGFREFYDYSIRDDTDDRTYATAVAEMKINTTKYAKRQVKWIRNKLLPAVGADVKQSTKAYLLDATGRFLQRDRPSRTHFTIRNGKETAGGPIAPDKSHRRITFTTKNSLPLLYNLLSKVPPTYYFHDEKQSARIVQLRNGKETAGGPIAPDKVICPYCTTEPNRPVMLEEGREWEIHQRTAAHRRMKRKADPHVDEL
uniref:H/ACA ribonucleoprotein complex subunit GAR1 n=1 Tax=Inonotus obliquus TaxID=167356 RepID=A0A345BJX1_9AGAM|nr:tRNA isopentenyl transferase [Inonotus obliquus]